MDGLWWAGLGWAGLIENKGGEGGNWIKVMQSRKAAAAAVATLQKNTEI